jgi:OOP family OmpA-OmpF porin
MSPHFVTRNNKMKKIILLAGLLGALSATSVMAWNNPGAFTLTLADSYYSFASKRHLDSNSVPNAALAYNFDERWAAEFNYGAINTNYHNSVAVHGGLYTLDGLYRFTSRGRFQPYVIGGIGMMGLKPTVNTEAQYQGNMNVGLGTQFFAANSIALRLEARDLYTMSGGKNDVMLNFGISFLFGGGTDMRP